MYYTDKPADGSSVADSNIGQFFAEWEGWSQLVSKGAEPSVYNAYFERYFQTFQDKLESATGRYLLLDQRVQVAKYDCNIGPETHPEWDFLSFAADYLEPESISFFTPVVKSEKKVLYLNPEAKEVPAQLPGNPAPGAPEILYLNIKKPFVIQLPTKPRHRMMQVKMQITVNSQENLDLVTLHEPLIKNAISEVLYKYQTQPDIYNQIEGRREVKAACLKEVQEAMLKETGKPVVEKVLFTDFVMQ